MKISIKSIEFISSSELDEIQMIHDRGSYDNISDHAVFLGDPQEIRRYFDINLELRFDKSEYKPAYMDLNKNYTINFYATCSLCGCIGYIDIYEKLTIHAIMGLNIDILNKFLDLDDIVESIKNSFDNRAIEIMNRSWIV